MAGHSVEVRCLTKNRNLPLKSKCIRIERKECNFSRTQCVFLSGQRARKSEKVSGPFVTLSELSMLIKKQADIASSEITPKNIYLNRRNFLVGAVLAGAAAVAGVGLSKRPSALAVTEGNPKIDGIQKSKFSISEATTPYKDVTNYNNYYEFSTDKYGPAGLAKDFRTRAVDGEHRWVGEETTKPRRRFDH